MLGSRAVKGSAEQGLRAESQLPCTTVSFETTSADCAAFPLLFSPLSGLNACRNSWHSIKLACWLKSPRCVPHHLSSLCFVAFSGNHDHLTGHRPRQRVEAAAESSPC